MLFIIQSYMLGRSGTEQERIAVETACSYGSKAAAFSSSAAEDVSLKVSMDGKGPKMGQDAELSITLLNSSAEHRTIVLHSQVSVMFYTGVHKAIIGRDRTDVSIQPNEGKFRCGVTVMKQKKWSGISCSRRLRGSQAKQLK